MSLPKVNSQMLCYEQGFSFNHGKNAVTWNLIYCGQHFTYYAAPVENSNKQNKENFRELLDLISVVLVLFTFFLYCAILATFQI